MIKKITRFTKIIIISLILIIAVLTISVGLIYYFYPEESALKLIKSRSEILLNRKIDIGSLRYSLKGIVIYNVAIYDKTENNPGPVLVKADEIVITFSLLSILKKDFRIRTLYFSGLEINTVFDKNGNSNIENLLKELEEKSEKSNGDNNVQLSKIIFNECRLKLTNPPGFIKPLEGEYQFDSTIRIKENKTFIITETKLILPIRRGILYPELKISNSERFYISGRIKLENASLAWVYKFAIRDPHLPFEVVNGQVNDLEITKEYIKGQAKATSTLKNSKSFILADGWCTVELNDRSVHLKDVKGKINSSSANVDNMLISSKEGKIKKFSFSSISFYLNDLRHLLNSIPAGLSGYAKGIFTLDGGFFNGKLDISNVSYKDKTEIFSGINTTVDIYNNIIKKENIPFTLFGNQSTLSIATTDNKFTNFYLSVNTEKVNLNNINLKEGRSGGDSGVDIPINITGKVNINELLYNDLIFKNTRANLTATGKSIKINNMDTSILSGHISGIGTIDISEATPSVHTSLRFNNLKIHDIKFENKKLINRLFGFAEGTANLNLQIKENAAETIRGNTTFTVTKGKVVDTGVQDGLIIFLSELRYKLKDLEFNKIYGNIDISGNNFTINSFIFNSEDVRLSMNGSIDKDLIAKNMELKLEFNNHFIKDVPRPAVAVFNEYSAGKWYVIPFSLNGNITESKNLKILKKNQ